MKDYDGPDFVYLEAQAAKREAEQDNKAEQDRMKAQGKALIQAEEKARYHWRRPNHGSAYTQYRKRGDRSVLAQVCESSRRFTNGMPVYEARLNHNPQLSTFSLETEEEAKALAEALVLVRRYAKIVNL